MNICLFNPEEVGKPLSLKDERGQHLVKILHKKKATLLPRALSAEPPDLQRLQKLRRKGFFLILRRLPTEVGRVSPFIH